MLRAERRWSQRDVAFKARMPASRYWEIERGYRTPTPRDQRRIARLFGVEVHDAFPDLVPPPAEQVPA